MITHTILYVADQQLSRDFYQKILGLNPILDVPGMTEFQLSSEHVLGLMPEKGIKRLLGDALPDPTKGQGIPRAELYFRVADPEGMFANAMKVGATELSPILERPWGMRAGYLMDPDAHVVAFSS